MFNYLTKLFGNTTKPEVRPLPTKTLGSMLVHNGIISPSVKLRIEDIPGAEGVSFPYRHNLVVRFIKSWRLIDCDSKFGNKPIWPPIVKTEDLFRLDLLELNDLGERVHIRAKMYDKTFTGTLDDVEDMVKLWEAKQVTT